MPSKSVLVLGGNGKVARLLTPMLLHRDWRVTSIIRNQEQEQAIKADAPSSGSLEVLVRSLEDVKSDADAAAIIKEASPDYVVWSAGAGGKGAPERTFTIDRDAAIHFIKASAADPTIKRFLMISYLGSRRSKPWWWSDEEWNVCVRVNEQVLPRYYQAKLAADEALRREARKRQDFVAICLRPGALTDGPAGKVQLGRTSGSSGTVSRASVAEVTARLLSLDDEETRGLKNNWLDLLDGDEEIGSSVMRVAQEGVDTAEGDQVFDGGK